MRVDISKITSAVNKVTAMTADIKSVPGVLLELSDGLLKVCFSDGHKSVIEKINVEMDEGDYIGGIVVPYESLSRAIANCQPSGIIKVGEVQFVYKQGNIVTISADQSLSITDAEGNVTGSKKMANKKMDIPWVAPGSDMKSAILSRMKYEEIFEAKDSNGNDIDVDKFNKKELIDALSRTSVEKGKQIYMSVKTQNIFVANQAHLTSVPVSKYTLTSEEEDEIRGTLSMNGTYSEENFRQALANATNRIHFSISMSQVMAKAVIDILNKTNAEEVCVYTKEKFCSMYIDTDDEHVGIWFEMTAASKAHLGTLEKYNALEYKNYQVMFIREFLSDIVKSAINATKSEKLEFKFEASTDENPSSPLDMVLESGSSASSTSDVYRINPDSIIDTTNDLQTKKFKVSLKVLSDMLAQIKTPRVAIDFNVAADDSTCIRISEIDSDELTKAFGVCRDKTKELCEQQGITFEATATPTPVELKIQYLRSDAIMGTRQYTMLSN